MPCTSETPSSAQEVIRHLDLTEQKHRHKPTQKQSEMGTFHIHSFTLRLSTQSSLDDTKRKAEMHALKKKLKQMKREQAQEENG